MSKNKNKAAVEKALIDMQSLGIKISELLTDENTSSENLKAVNDYCDMWQNVNIILKEIQYDLAELSDLADNIND